MTAAGWLETIISLSVQIMLLICTTALLVRWQKLSPHAHRLWAACHVSILFLAILAFGFPHLRLVSLTFETSHDRFLEEVRAVETVLGVVVLSLWGIGVAISLLVLVAGSIKTVFFLKGSQPVELNPNINIIGSQEVLIRSHAGIQSLFCWQIHQPVIILPEHILCLPANELEMIIRHETEHLKAAHPLHLFLQRLVEAFFWFHPLVWWSSRQAIFSRESHCDNHSVTCNNDAIVYLQCLLRLAKQRHLKWSSLTTGFSFTTSSSLIQQRATLLATHDWDSPRLQGNGHWGLISILGISILSASLWIPLDISETNRSLWSPWPRWSANSLHAIGISVRDYEIDNHRLQSHH